MTTLEVGTTTVLDAFRKVAPEIAERAEEIENAKQIPADLLQKIQDTGALRMFVPREYGGEELTLSEAMEVFEEAGRADAGTAWSIMIASDFGLVFGRFPKKTLDEEVYADGPDALARGAFAPKGVAIPVDGGYIVKGQWPLASGSYQNQWAMANCIVLENGQPRMTPIGTPEMKLVMLPASEVQYLDTWHSLGVVASNSGDFVINEVFVPTHHTAELFGPAAIDSPAFRIPTRIALAPTHVAICVGIARGALDDVRELARTKRPAFNPGMRLAQDPTFQYRLGLLDTRLEAVAAQSKLETQKLWDAAVEGKTLDVLPSLRQRAAVAWAHTECVDIVNECFALAGSNAMYLNSPIQRRLRDVRTAAQHVAASGEIYAILGAIMAGEEVPPAALI